MNTGNIIFKSPMKASHILLLCTVATILLMLTSYIVVVKYKVGNDDFTYVNNDKTKYTITSLSAGKVISLIGIGKCMIISSDVAKVEIWNEEKDRYVLKTEGDTIRLSTKSINTIVAHPVMLYLPSDTKITADSSALELKGSFQDTNHTGFYLKIHNTTLIAAAPAYHTFFENLDVSCTGESQISILSGVHIKTLTLHDAYNFNVDQTWQIENLKMRYDKKALGVEQSNGKMTVKLNSSMPKIL